MFDWQKTILSQYEPFDDIKSLIGSFAEAMDIGADLDAMRAARVDVDTAVGEGLDVIGRWVGLSRYIPVGLAGSGPYIGFKQQYAGDPSATPQTWGHGTWFRGGRATQYVRLDDEPFRQAIRVKALANISDNTIPSLNKMLMLLFGARGAAFVRDNGNMSAEFVFNFELTDIEKYILTSGAVIPKIDGVSIGLKYEPSAIVVLSEDFSGGVAGASIENYSSGGWLWRLGQAINGDVVYPGEQFVFDSAGGVRRDGWVSSDQTGSYSAISLPSSRKCANDVEYVYEIDLVIPESGFPGYVIFDAFLERRRMNAGTNFWNDVSQYWVRSTLYANALGEIQAYSSVRRGAYNCEILGYSRLGETSIQTTPSGQLLYGSHTLRIEKRSTSIRVYWDDTLLRDAVCDANGSGLGPGTADGWGYGTGGAFGFGWSDHYTNGTDYSIIKCTAVRLTEYPSGIPA